MSVAIVFDATLWRPASRWARMFVAVPVDVKSRFGRSRCPVHVTIDGYTWRTTIEEIGGVPHIAIDGRALIASRATVGDTVHVDLVSDDGPAPVSVPTELANLLRRDTRARDAFDALTESNRRACAAWVGEVKWPETRSRRAETVRRLLR